MKSSLVNMVLSLGIITIIAAALLAGVYAMTLEPIAQADAQKQKDAISAVLPGMTITNDPSADKADIALPGETEDVIVFPATDNGQLVGVAVQSYSNNGFSGHISVMYGFDTEGNITGYSVMQHAETPGLGSKMQEWFSDPAHTIVGLNANTANLTVSKDGGDVDAITAATISSRAFLDALRRAKQAYDQYATQQ